MNSETIKENEKRFFEYVNKKDVKAVEKWIDEFVDDDFVNHSIAFNESANKEGLKEMFRTLFQLVPDIKITIKEMIFEKDILCFRHIIRGIGKTEDSMKIAMVRFKNGKAIDRWVV